MTAKPTLHNGFTLIEIMVALAVFALAAMALVRLESATIRGAGILDQTLAAQMVARTIAVETVTDAGTPTPGKTGGTAANAGRRWIWTRDVQPIGDAGVFRVDVSVADGSGTSLARLTMIRPPATPA